MRMTRAGLEPATYGLKGSYYPRLRLVGQSETLRLAVSEGGQNTPEAAPKCAPSASLSCQADGVPHPTAKQVAQRRHFQRFLRDLCHTSVAVSEGGAA